MGFDYDIDRLVIVVGAGMSRNKPTNLPNGPDLSDFCLNQVLGDAAQEILQEWAEIDKNLHKDYSKGRFISIGKKPRLETIISAYKNASKIDSSFSFLEGFKSMINREFNEGHFLLAALYEMGANIITFNFDICINKAFNFLTGGEVLCQEEFSQPLFRAKGRKNYILYIHGLANNIETMGFDIQGLIKGYGDDVKCLIMRFLQDRMNFLTVGYSCCDSLDFNPLMKSLKKKNESWVNIINHVQESTSIEVYDPQKESRKPSDEELRFLRFKQLFFDGQIINANTQLYLRKLIEAINPKFYLKIYKLYEKYQPNSEIGDWEKEFEEAIPTELNEKARKIALIYMVDSLRVGYKLLSRKDVAKIRREYGKQLIYIQQNCAKFCNYKSILRRTSRRIALNNNDFSGLKYLKNRKNRKKDYLMALKTVQEKEYFTWDVNCPITTIQNEIRSITKKYIYQNCRDISYKDENNLEKALKALEKITSLEYKNFSKLNLIGLSKRLILIVRVFLYGENLIGEYYSILDNYYIDISLLDGIPSVYRDMAICSFLFYKYHAKKDKQLLENVKFYLKKSRMYADIMGNKRDSLRASLLLRKLQIINKLKWLYNKHSS